MSTRRSSRVNKGQHSKREIDFYEEEEDFPSAKRRLLSASAQDNTRWHLDQEEEDGDYKEDGEEKKDDDIDDEGEVRCTPCGTTSENYDEDDDQGGTMIECESCKTWQHAKCMGYKTSKAIPKHYKCNICSGLDDKKPEKSFVESSSISEKLKDKTRASVAKAFVNVFKRNIPESYNFPEGMDNEKLSSKWAIQLEREIFVWCPKKDKKYTDKSRSLMVLIKKPNVMNRIMDGELSFTKLVNSSPEEIDSELKEYADKVRLESIRRSVLTVDSSQGQRIRRTHKGEEIVEDANNQQEDVDISIMTRNIDHRRFEDKEPPREIIVNDNNKAAAYNNYMEDDDDEEEREEKSEQKQGSDKEGSSSDDKEGLPLSDIDDVPDLDDEELDFIIKGKTEPKEVTKKPLNVKLPPIQSSKIWSGRITFPDFASFSATGEFYTCSNYQNPTNPQEVKIHNRFINISKEILSKDHYEVEGRLERTRADAYLNKIITTRDLILVEITCTENQSGYDKLYRYLLERNKVGVLSGRPAFVKDAYLLGIDGNDFNLPEYLKSLHNIVGKVGLFALYIVKKDYIPTGPSILKKSTPAPTDYNSHNSNTSSKEKTPLLDSILYKLGGNDTRKENIQIQSPQYHSPVAQNGLPANLTTDQLSYLSGLVQQNPHVQQNPQALIQLLQQQKSSDYSAYQ